MCIRNLLQSQLFILLASSVRWLLLLPSDSPVIFTSCLHWMETRFTIGLFSGTVLNVRKHIFEWKHRKSSHNFSSFTNKMSFVIGCNKRMIRHCVIWELIDIVSLKSPMSVGHTWNSGELYLEQWTDRWWMTVAPPGVHTVDLRSAGRPILGAQHVPLLILCYSPCCDHLM